MIERAAIANPALEPFVPRIKGIIKKVEMASIQMNKTAILKLLDVGLNDSEKLFQTLRFSPMLSDLAKTIPASVKKLKAEIEDGTKDPRDLNVALGSYYNQFSPLLPPLPKSQRSNVPIVPIPKRTNMPMPKRFNMAKRT